MISLNLPAYATKTMNDEGRTMIYDFLRRRYVALTPEEWVRQHFTHFLIEHKHYPAALLPTKSPCGSARRHGAATASSTTATAAARASSPNTRRPT